MFARKVTDTTRRPRTEATFLKFALAAAAAAATSVGVAATAHADTGYELFQSPSGKVLCETTISYKGDPYANCTVRDSAYPIPADKCDIAPPVNPQFGLTQGRSPSLSCVVGSGDYQWPTLDFGQTRSVGTITCDSEASGMTCTDTSTGHFFRISNDSYDLG
jgi:hypothetical protein